MTLNVIVSSRACSPSEHKWLDIRMEPSERSLKSGGVARLHARSRMAIGGWLRLGPGQGSPAGGALWAAQMDGGHVTIVHPKEGSVMLTRDFLLVVEFALQESDSGGRGGGAAGEEQGALKQLWWSIEVPCLSLSLSFVHLLSPMRTVVWLRTCARL